MTDWIAEVKARGVADVADALGLTVQARSSTDTSVSPCPACQAEHRGSSDRRRGPIGLTADGGGWHCHRPDCQAGGDAVDLAALVARGVVPGKGDTAGWAEVQACCAAHGLCLSESMAATWTPTVRAPRPTPPAIPTPPPRRPPEGEVDALWDRCLPATDDADVRAWLEQRLRHQARVLRVADRDLARALPRDALPDWCRYLGESWWDTTHRLLVAMYGPGGRLESLHARALRPTRPGDKAASPRGAAVRGLVMADALGRELLAGNALPLVGRVLIAEGVPDFLTAATHYGDTAEDAPAVLGVISGSWTSAIAATIPTGWTVIIATDHDADGEKYAAHIHATLTGRCECRRMRVSPYPESQKTTT